MEHNVKFILLCNLKYPSVLSRSTACDKLEENVCETFRTMLTVVHMVLVHWQGTQFLGTVGISLYI